MKRLPLYPEPNTSAVEDTPPSDLNPKCGRCPLNREGLRSPCIGADGSRYKPGDPTLLVVGDFPTYEDDGAGRIMTTAPFMRLRKTIEEMWSGSIVYDVGIRCAPGDTKLKPDFVNACRGYLAGTIAEVKPDRILTFGAYAGRAVLGRQIPPLSVRKGYAFTSYGAPIFMLMSPAEAAWNRFNREWLDEDLKWAIDADPKRPPWDATYGVIETREDAEQAVEVLRDGGWVTYDTEWSGLMFNGPDSYYELLDLAIVSKGNPNGFLWDRHALNNPETWGPLANLLTDPSVLKMGQNLKADVMSVMARKKYRANVQGVAGDLLLWRKGLSSDIDGSLDFAAELVGMGGHKEENDAYVKDACEQIKYARKLAAQGVQFTPGIYSNAIVGAVQEPDADPKAFAYAEVPDDIRGRYCMLDTVTTDLTAVRVYEERLRNDREMLMVNEHFIVPATTAFSQVEAWGMGFDREANRLAAQFLEQSITALREKIAKYGDFNPSSDAQIAEFLYVDQGIACQKFTKNESPSVDKDALDAIKTRHPVIPLLIEHNELDTIQGTFAAGMQKHIRGDNRVHTSFLLSGTRSGRLSSANPNLQNIPSRNPDLAKMIKNCFVAGHGRVLLQLDYSQLEYRVAAMLSQDPNFMQVFIDGHDCHRRTAELAAPYVHGVSIEQAEAMTDKEIKGWRSDAKTINFGVLYGKTVRTLAKDLGTTIEKAQQFYDVIMGNYAVLGNKLQEWIAYARRHGMCWTYLVTDEGIQKFRRRNLLNIAGHDDYLASKAKNGAVNTPVQGTAADYMNRTVCAVVDWILGDHIPAKVINTVHDSIIIEVDERYANEVALTVKYIMEQWPSAGVPIIADVEVGRSWGNMRGATPTDTGWEYKTNKDLIAHASNIMDIIS